GWDSRDRVIWRAGFDQGLPANAPYGLPQMGDAGLVAMTQYDFDYLGRLKASGQWQLESGTVAWTSIARDDAHRTTSITRDGAVRTIRYDAVDRRVSGVLPNQATITFGYAGNDVHRAVTTAGGVDETIESYDGLGLLSRVASASGKERMFEQHDLDG